MKKRCFLSVVFVLSFVFLFSGVCFALPKIEPAQIATGGASGSWLQIGAGIADKANDLFEGFPISAVPGPGSVSNPLIVASGEGDIGFSYPPFLVAAQEGKAPYDKKITNLRAVCGLIPTVVHFVATDLPDKVSSVEDIIEQKVKIKISVPPLGSGSYAIANIIFDASGLESIDEIDGWGGKVRYENEVTDGWKDRHVNAFVATYNVPSSSVNEAIMSRPGKVLPIGEGLVEKLGPKGFSKFVIPEGTYSNQKESILTVSLPMVVFARDDTDEELVYAITKTIYEESEFLVNVHSSMKEFDRTRMAEISGMVMHPGAEKFYKEVGLLK